LLDYSANPTQDNEVIHHGQVDDDAVFKSVEVDLAPDEAYVDVTEPFARATSYALVSYHSLPPYLKGNEYIVSGYRLHFSFKLCLLSLFKLHNESLNIWTHLIGTLLFSILAVITFRYWLPSSSFVRTGDYLIFTVFFFGAHAQMLFSTLFHLFCAHSANAFKWLARLDYTGISLMIVGSYFPPLYYTLRDCHPTLMTVHLVLISALGLIGVSVTLLTFFQAPKFRTFRALFFIIFAAYIIFPLPHMVYLMGFKFMWPMMWRLFVMGGLYITGAFIYAKRCPECCAPGKFDLWWSSHPIWHLFVIAAGLFQVYNCLFAFFYYSNQTCKS